MNAAAVGNDYKIIMLTNNKLSMSVVLMSGGCKFCFMMCCSDDVV